MLAQDLSGAAERILVCQQRQIGDVLLAEPSLALLKARYPGADIHVFTEPKCEPLLRHNPHVHAFHLIDKSLPWFGQRAWRRAVAARNFDLVVDFQQLPRCRAMLRAARAANRAGVRLSFPAPWHRCRLYTHGVAPLPGYAAATKASLLRPLGIVWNGEAPRIYLTDAERAEARALLAALGLGAAHTLVTVDATHRRASKRWPHYAALLNLLAEARPDLRFLLLRGPGEEDDMRALLAACERPERVFLPQPLPDIRLAAACMAEAALHVGNCSSPRHMAVALDVPSLIIPGASGPEWHYPSPLHRELRPELPCAPCHRIDCADPRCLALVTPALAADAAFDMLETLNAHANGAP